MRPSTRSTATSAVRSPPVAELAAQAGETHHPALQHHFVSLEQQRSAVSMPGASSVDELVKALNAIGASPRDLIAILQALKAVGSLDAELEVL